MKFYPIEQIERLMIGRWEVLLSQYWDKRAFNGRHQACPLCGGKDRFRWGESKQDVTMKGRGAAICNQCGSHLGLWWFMQTTGYEFPVALHEIGANFLKVEPDQEMTTEPVIARDAFPKAPRVRLEEKNLSASQKYIRKQQAAPDYDRRFWMAYDLIETMRKYHM